MHVVILAEFATASGGAEKVALESARGLAEAGVRVTYIQAIAGKADPFLDHAGITRIELALPDIWSLGPVRGAVAGLWHRTAARRLDAALAGLPAGITCLHLHQWTRTFSPAIMPVLFGHGAPVVATLHDYFLACPNGVYYRFDRGEPCTLRPMSGACLAAPCDPRSPLHKVVRVARTGLLGRALAGRPLHVVHVCDASLGRIGGMLGHGPLTHHRIDNPVRPIAGEPADPARGDAIAYVGRLTREKGADLVAAAARKAGLKALFVGAGPLEDELRAMPGVEVMGWRAPEEVWAILRHRARALAAPSRWFETGPLTVYEALAAGLPVVASDRSGAAEKVRHGETGFVVPPDTEALVTAFSALRDDGWAAAMGRAARQRWAEAPLDLSAHARCLVALYGSIGAGHSAASHHIEPLPSRSAQPA